LPVELFPLWLPDPDLGSARFTAPVPLLALIAVDELCAEPLPHATTRTATHTNPANPGAIRARRGQS
jgi:hypothetical protein